MASIDIVYQDLGQLFKLAEQVNDSNWNSDMDLAETAEKLEEIEGLAAKNSALLAGLDNVLEG